MAENESLQNDQPSGNPVTGTQPSADPQDKQERTWATFCHLSALVAFLGIPFGNVIGPLVLWLIKKNEMPLVEAEGKSALNFQISMTIYTLVTFLLCFVGIGFLLIFPVIIFNAVFVIIAAIKTSNGEIFQYPVTIQLIK